MIVTDAYLAYKFEQSELQMGLDEVDFTTFIGQLAYELINNEFLDSEERHARRDIDNISICNSTPIHCLYPLTSSCMQAVHKCLLLSSLPHTPGDYWEMLILLQYICAVIIVCSDRASHRIVALCNPGKQTYFEEHLNLFK